MKTRKYFYGWVPDLPDQRDFLYSAIRKAPRALPKSVDLRTLCSKVEDQGELGSCTANALAGALEFLETKDKVAFTDFSRLFIYYNERVIEHSTKYDNGAMIRDGIKTLAKQGACTEKKWPYVVSANPFKSGKRHLARVERTLKITPGVPCATRSVLPHTGADGRRSKNREADVSRTRFLLPAF